MPCDWIGIVTIRSETRCSRSTKGMKAGDHARPARVALHSAETEQNATLVPLEDPHPQCQAHESHERECHKDVDDGHVDATSDPVGSTACPFAVRASAV